jgi:hypothetical protein
MYVQSGSAELGEQGFGIPPSQFLALIDPKPSSLTYAETTLINCKVVRDKKLVDMRCLGKKYYRLLKNKMPKNSHFEICCRQRPRSGVP